MNAISKRWLAAAIGTAGLGWAVLGPLAPNASAHSPDPVVGGALWEPNQAVHYRWRSGQVPPDWLRSPIHAAADDSNDTRASRAAVFTYDAAGAGVIAYGEPTGCGPNGIACFDRSDAPVGFSMAFRRHGQVFDWGVLRWCQALDPIANGCFDAENIALDEFGHVQSLGHHLDYTNQSDYLDAVVQTVSHARPGVGWNAHALARCDVATLQKQYDMRSWAAPYSSCLDLATTASLTVSDSTPAYGGLVVFTATLRIVDLDSYGRLGGNPVSDRVVLLQRRPVGGSTWSTVVQMDSASASGTYVAGLTLTTGADWRALFSAPGAEGLEADASPAIAVRPSGCTSGCPSSGGRR
jgi:hypothetical protein